MGKGATGEAEAVVIAHGGGGEEDRSRDNELRHEGQVRPGRQVRPPPAGRGRWSARIQMRPVRFHHPHGSHPHQLDMFNSSMSGATTFTEARRGSGQLTTTSVTALRAERASPRHRCRRSRRGLPCSAGAGAACA